MHVRGFIGCTDDLDNIYECSLEAFHFFSSGIGLCISYTAHPLIARKASALPFITLSNIIKCYPQTILSRVVITVKQILVDKHFQSPV